MKRLISLIFGAVIAPILVSVPVRAQAPGLLFGQKHYYSVTFRANDEAIVLARIVVTNNTGAPIETLNFTAGSDELTELTALQMILPQVCEKYNYGRTYDPDIACDKYGDPDYTTTYSYNPDGEQIKYFRAEKTDKQDGFSIKLNTPIPVDKSGSVVIAYVSKSYVNSYPFGVRKYSFRTLGSDSRQGDTNIALDLDSGLTFKNQPQYRDYGIYSLATADMALSSGAESSAPIENKTLDSVISNIGLVGQKTEQASGVAPNEQFEINGEFANARWKLYKTEAFLVVLGAIVLVGLIYLIRRKLQRRKPNLKK